MGLYISRGPFSGDPGSSEFAPYLSKQTLTQIKKFLMNSREIDSNLESVTDARFVSVGGTQNEINDDLVINEGDQVLHATVDDNSLDNIYAQQTVSSVVGSNVSKSTRQDLASLIWSEKDAKNACSLWFSIIPVINLNGAYSYTSAQNVCEQSREMIPDSLSWQEDDLYIIPEAADDENQKPADLLKSVGGWSTSGTRYTQQEAFILQVESDESQRYTNSLKFDENIPGIRQLIESSGNAQVIYKNESTFYATGFLGDVQQSDDNDETIEATIHGCQGFDPVDIGAIRDLLSVTFPEQYEIFSIDNSDLQTILRASEPTTPGPDYQTIGEAYTDITARLEENGKQGWLSAQPADVVIEGWTDALQHLDQETTVPWQAATKLQQLAELYEEYKLALEVLCADIRAGTLKSYNPTETLFVTLFRNLQERSGYKPNFTTEKLRTIRKERYSIRFPSERNSSYPIAYIDPPEPPEDADVLARQIQKTKQIVLYGPPGTGKTYVAKQFANWWVAQQDKIRATTDQVRTVTFHPSYSYEDFVEGLTANSKPDGNVSYDVEPGIFRQLCSDARDAYREAPSPGQAARYVLIIDEINRGNLSQILGELVTTLERDKREGASNATRVELAHSGKQFSIPPNVYIIGTMNTADRSIALIDDAIRRRFRFVSRRPDYQVVMQQYSIDYDVDTAIDHLSVDTDLKTALVILSISGLKIINNRILDSSNMQKGQQVGHTYLLNLHGTEEVLDAWKYEILPLIEEHYFGQFDRIRQELFDGGGENLFNWDAEEIRMFDESALIEALMRLIDTESMSDMRNQIHNISE